MLYWLLENNTFSEGIESIINSLKKLGIPFRVIEYKPYFEINLKELFPNDSCVVFQGSLQTAKHIRKKASWIPGVYYDVPKYNCVNYYAKLGKYLLNDNYIFLPFCELARRKEFLFNAVGQDRTIFLRPNRGDKIFTGKLIYKEHFDREIEVIGFGPIEPEELVVVAEPHNIKFEWRLVVVDSQVVAASQYKERNVFAPDPSCPQEVFDFAQEIVKIFNPEPAWVLDICLTNELRVVEVGCFSCAGLYCCDRDRVIEAVSSVAIKEWKEINEI